MRVEIKLPTGFAPEIALYASGLEYGREQTRKLLVDLSPVEIAVRPFPSIHSIGALALHLGEAEYFWIQCVVAGRELSDEEKRFAHFFDTMETDVDKGFDSAYLISKLDAIFVKTSLKTVSVARRKSRLPRGGWFGMFLDK
ncbi:hypothetical protein BH20ACI2_BH20ACI2_22300 [soil metagenome]